MKTTARDMKIFKEYTATNRRDLCERYSISLARLYKIISACRRKSRTKALTEKLLPIGIGHFDSPSKFARYMRKNAHLGFKGAFLLNANAARLADREWTLLMFYLAAALSRRGQRGAS